MCQEVLNCRYFTRKPEHYEINIVLKNSFNFQEINSIEKNEHLPLLTP